MKGLPRVARSEGALLTLTRALFEPKRASTVRRIVQGPTDLPRRIGPTAMGLFKSTLARGVLRDLLRAGGWRVQGAVGSEPGRLWARHPQLRLDFTAQTAELLLGMTRRSADGQAQRPPHDPTPADRWVRGLALELLCRLDMPVPADAFATAPLCWLLRPERLARAAPLPTALDFMPLVTGPMAAWMEAIQPRLARRWIALERRKPSVRKVAQMTRLGAAQHAALIPFFAACDKAGRRDLATFAVHAAQAVLAPTASGVRPELTWWIESLGRESSLRARQTAYTASAALLDALHVPARWHAEHGQTAFFDDEYDAAQHLLAAWEGLGRAGFDRAAHLAKGLRDYTGPSAEPVGADEEQTA